MLKGIVAGLSTSFWINARAVLASKYAIPKLPLTKISGLGIWEENTALARWRIDCWVPVLGAEISSVVSATAKGEGVSSPIPTYDPSIAAMSVMPRIGNSISQSDCSLIVFSPIRWPPGVRRTDEYFLRFLQYRSLKLNWIDADGELIFKTYSLYTLHLCTLREVVISVCESFTKFYPCWNLVKDSVQTTKAPSWYWHWTVRYR